MPPKKASQAHLVVLQNNQGKTLEILGAYTTADAAEADIEQRDAQDGLEVMAVELKSTVTKKAATKEVPSRAKPAMKRTKKQEVSDDDEEDDDDDDNEQAKATAKKAAGDNKRKQVAQGKEGSLDGLKLVFTGTFIMNRKTCEATAVKHGASIVTSLKQADLIVLGTKPGPKKVAEIEGNGYDTVDEDEFHAMLQGDGEAAKKKTKSSS